MVRQVISFALGLFVASAAFFFFSPQQTPQAEGTAAAVDSLAQVAVVDVQKILAEAKAAQDLQKQITKLQEDLQSEIKKYDEELKKEEKALADKQKTLSQEELGKQVEALQKKAQGIREKIQTRRTELEQAVNKSLGQLRENLLQVIGEMSVEKGFRIVLNKQNLIVSHENLEITDAVMTTLNTKISSISIDVR